MRGSYIKKGSRSALRKRTRYLRAFRRRRHADRTRDRAFRRLLQSRTEGVYRIRPRGIRRTVRSGAAHHFLISGIRWRTGELDLRAGDHGKALLGDARILMEIKLPGVCPMWLAGILSENGAFPVPFSKYGTCYRENILKKDFCEKEAHFCA